MKNKKIFFFSIFFILMISLGAVSASEDIMQDNDFDLNAIEQNQDDGNIDLLYEEGDTQDDTNPEGDGDTNNPDDPNIQPSEPANSSNDQQTFSDIQNLIDNAEAGSTIKLNGTYIGDSKEIIINKNLTIKGINGKATLNAKALSRIFNITANGVVLENLNLINGKSDLGGAIYSENKFTVKNCDLKNNKAKLGGAIYLYANQFKAYSAIIEKSYFKNNTARCGGAIYSGANLKVLNSEFTSNTANSGGAICCEDYDDMPHGDKLYISSCKFYKNRVVTATNDPNYHITYPYGGALLIDFEKAYINNTVFKHNSAVTEGGAIALTRNLTMQKSQFTNNSAKSGAVIEVIPNIIDFEEYSFKGLIKLTNCIIGSNKAKNNLLINCDYMTPKLDISNLVMGKYKYTIKEYGKRNYFVVKLINKKTNKAVKGANIRLKLKYYPYNKGEKTLVMTKKTNKNGKAVFEVISQIKRGDFSEVKFYFSFANSKKYPIMISGYPEETIPLTVKAPKVSAKYKKSKYFYANFKNKATGKVLKYKKVKIRVYTGTKYKDYNLKTNKKGTVKINTKSLSKGTHKVTIYFKQVWAYDTVKGVVEKVHYRYESAKKSSITIK